MISNRQWWVSFYYIFMWDSFKYNAVFLVASFLAQRKIYALNLTTEVVSQIQFTEQKWNAEVILNATFEIQPLYVKVISSTNALLGSNWNDSGLRYRSFLLQYVITFWTEFSFLKIFSKVFV